MSEEHDQGASPEKVTCPTCGGQVVAGYPCGECARQKAYTIQGPESVPPRPASWLERELNWPAIGTIGLFVLIQVYSNRTDAQGTFYYRLGGLVGSVGIGYGVYRLGRFIARRRKDGMLSPDLSTRSPTPMHDRVWSRGAALVLILAVGVASAVRSGGSFEDGFFHGMEESARERGISEESWACVEDGLRQSGYVTALGPLAENRTEAQLVALFTNAAASPLAEAPPEIRQLLEETTRLMAVCLSLDEFTALAIVPQSGAPDDYGSDPQLDSLHDGCVEGTFSDCDMLWLVSNPASEYEEVALTCGGREGTLDPNDPFCMLIYDEDSMPSIRLQCEQGFFPACDLLHLMSEVGSSDETLATTCGHRREATEYLACWMDLGLGSR